MRHPALTDDMAARAGLSIQCKEFNIYLINNIVLVTLVMQVIMLIWMIRRMKKLCTGGEGFYSFQDILLFLTTLT